MEIKTKKTVGKYLTDMKELPPVQSEDESVEKPKQPTNTPQGKKEVKHADTPINRAVATAPAVEESGESEDGRRFNFTSKDLILGVINLITIIFLVVLLIKLPVKAGELKALKLEELKQNNIPAITESSISGSRKKAEELNNLFLDDAGVANYFSEVEKIKLQNPSIQKVAVNSPKVIKDKTGLYGFPVTIELKGEWSLVGTALEKIQALPYLFRPVSIKTERSKDDPKVILFSYGGFLYTKDAVGKTR